MTTNKKRLVTVRGSDTYKEDLFLIWYRKGRPSAKLFYNLCPENKDGQKPAQNTLKRWISSEFKARAKILDDAVHKQLEVRLVNEKVEMLDRHAALGEKMQQMGADWLLNHKDELTASVAVRLLVEGWRIERESSGIPAAIEKIVSMTDEELLGEVEDLINASTVVVESE